MARRHILIVEDERAFAEVLTELLIDEGYSVVTVRDGVTALKMVGGPGPRADVVICDVMLPGLRGDRLAAEIRSRFPRRRLPILLMSASADPSLKLRDVEFMSKPFETSELLSRIASMLAPAVPAT
jgi:two-component system, OmpR family, response regulator MprA